MKTIWKFDLLTTDCQVVSMPKDSKIISVQTQFDEPCIWAVVDDQAETEDRYFVIVGTGHQVLHDNLLFIGTFQLHTGALVFHLFENKEAP